MQTKRASAIQIGDVIPQYGTVLHIHAIGGVCCEFYGGGKHCFNPRDRLLVTGNVLNGAQLESGEAEPEPKPYHGWQWYAVHGGNMPPM